MFCFAFVCVVLLTVFVGLFVVLCWLVLLCVILLPLLRVCLFVLLLMCFCVLCVDLFLVCLFCCVRWFGGDASCVVGHVVFLCCLALLLLVV